MKAKKYTKAEWNKAIKWGKEFLGLKDWAHEIWWHTRPSWADGYADGLGASTTDRQFKHAKIWVNVPECNAKHVNIDPLQVLFHEILHIGFVDVGMQGDDGDLASPAIEFLLHCLEKAMLAAYRKGVK